MYLFFIFFLFSFFLCLLYLSFLTTFRIVSSRRDRKEMQRMLEAMILLEMRLR